MLNKNKIKIINKDLIVNKNNKYLFKIENNKDPYNFYNLIHSINKNNKYLFKKKNNFKEKILKNISRASKYRGVSKNGNKWQVHMMVNKKNKYFGSYKYEIFAAIVYDILSIKKDGLNSKTNFKYSINEIEKINLK